MIACPWWGVCDLYICPGGAVLDCPWMRAPGIIRDGCSLVYNGRDLASSDEAVAVLVAAAGIDIVGFMVYYRGETSEHVLEPIGSTSLRVVRAGRGLVSIARDNLAASFVLYEPVPHSVIRDEMLRGAKKLRETPVVPGAPELGTTHVYSVRGDWSCTVRLVEDRRGVCGGIADLYCYDAARRVFGFLNP